MSLDMKKELTRVDKIKKTYEKLMKLLKNDEGQSVESGPETSVYFSPFLGEVSPFLAFILPFL